MAQSQLVQNYFVFGYQGLYAVAMIAVLLIFCFWKLDKELPGIQKTIGDRHREDALAAGLEWHSAEEILAAEQTENDRLTEEERIEELKAKCAKKGLDFDAEEAKYQVALAEKQVKAEARAAKKAAKHGK